MKIRTRFAIYIISLVVITSLVYITFFLIRTNRLLKIGLIERGEALTCGHTVSSQLAILSGDETFVSAFLSAVMEDPDVIYCAIYTDEGRVVVMREEIKMRELPPVAIDDLKKGEVLSEIHTENDKPFYEIFTPIRVVQVPGFFTQEREGELIGFIRLGLSTDRIERRFRRALIIGLSFGVSVIGMGFLVALFLSGRITEPIKKLVTSTRAIARGDFTTRVDIGSTDELGEIGMAFNWTVEQLQAQRTKLTEYSKTLESRVQERTRKLEELNEAKSRFVSTFSHDIRTPLTTISGYTSLLLSKKWGDLTQEQEDRMRKIFESARDMNNFIDKVLDLSRIESGKTPITLQKVNPAEIIEKSIEDFAPIAKEKEQSIKFTGDRSVNTAYADPKAMQRILNNLLDNAVKYTARDGKIEVSLIEKEEFIQINVKDNGQGIPKEELDNIFREFYTLPNRSGEVTRSTGLGLSIVKQLIDTMGGTVLVESESVDRGSTFRFTLKRVV